MRHSAIRISESYAVSEAQRSALARADSVYGDAQVAPDELGGYFDYTDWRGQPVSQQNFLGRWTFLYFGYSRCQGSCRAVAPLIAKAAAELRAKGFAAKATFVDIETQPVATPRISTGPKDRHRHDSNWPMRFAMSQLYLDQGGALDVVTGTRAQLAAATAAFHVMREHVPPRSNEKATSINHSSMIYLLGLDTYVAGYGYHDMAADGLVALVEQLSTAERRSIDYSAVRNRYVRGACGNDG